MLSLGSTDGKILLTHFFSKIKDLFYTTLFFDSITSFQYKKLRDILKLHVRVGSFGQ